MRVWRTGNKNSRLEERLQSSLTLLRTIAYCGCRSLIEETFVSVVSRLALRINLREGAHVCRLEAQIPQGHKRNEAMSGAEKGTFPRQADFINVL